MGLVFIGKEVSGALGLEWGLPGLQSMPLLPLAVAWTKAACVDTTVARRCLGGGGGTLTVGPFEGHRKEALSTGRPWEGVVGGRPSRV